MSMQSINKSCIVCFVHY